MNPVAYPQTFLQLVACIRIGRLFVRIVRIAYTRKNCGQVQQSLRYYIETVRTLYVVHVCCLTCHACKYARTVCQLIYLTFVDRISCFMMTAPSTVINKTRDEDPDYLLLSVTGTVISAGVDNGWNFTDEARLAYLGRWHHAQGGITFIQTDKPIYKPGQLGKILHARNDGSSYLTFDQKII